MADTTLAALAPSISKMGTTTITNSTTRWFAQRYNVNLAWLFGGAHGLLTGTYVSNRNRCRAVTLLNIE